MTGNEATFSFPEGFLFGTSTSATQVEGHCTGTDWWAFCQEPGRVQGGAKVDVACDHWHRFREDVALQRELGMGAHRLSIEWARVEPRPGEIDRGALDRYREELGALRDAGIEPFVTFHHFALPRWLADRGGLENPELPARLESYTRTVAEALGDLSSFWITLNEPNVVVAQGYVTAVWPPAKPDPLAAFRAHMLLLESHVRMYRALHETLGARGKRPSVGLANHLRIFAPERPLRRDRLASKVLQHVFNDAFASAVCTESPLGPLDRMALGPNGFRVVEAKGTQDFFGVNYYSRDQVRLDPRRKAEAFMPRSVPSGAEVTDMGWEVFPEGLGQVLDEWSKRAGAIPVYVTENGLSDPDDDQRPSFLVRHLAEVARARARGVDVRGYLHWSLLDNFEWSEGYGPRFGLVAVDYETQQRTVRGSGRLFAAIARARAIDAATWEAHGTAPLRVRRAGQRPSVGV